MPEDAFHQRLKRRRGSATAHSCVECGGPALEWAYQHGGDPEDYEGYSPMCRSCHRKLDHAHGTPLPYVPGSAHKTAEERQRDIAAAVQASAEARRYHQPGCYRRPLKSTGACPCGARKG